MEPGQHKVVLLLNKWATKESRITLVDQVKFTTKGSSETIEKTKRDGEKQIISETAYVKTMQTPGMLSICVINEEN